MRRPRESVARGHTTPPLQVEVVNPLADHPALTPLIDKRTKRVAAKVKGSKRGSKQKVKVDVSVQAEAE